ncbi:MAG TPA: isoleucine--tRNA ligase [Candidatus Saccharibacteria bacterium]|nr:isoleucine--tRNA ligase [Candidatus Saccharibacteria bacterium]
MTQQKSNLAKIEEAVLGKWQADKTFEKSMEQRKGGPFFSFYDGPPFANGLPHFGHSLVTAIKDSVLRYKTMQGFYVPRRNGWDCHGLPVEFAIEKEFGVSGKKQILELGLEKFNNACNDSIFKYKGEWEVLLQRLGRWSEYDNYYATVDNSYTESVWWALSQINEKGLLYKGFKSTAYCPRCETPLSNFEVNDGYKDDVPDPSLFVKFKLADEDAFLLGWTTTPWSLPGNAAIAVNPTEEYVYARLKDDDGKEEVIILAKKRLEVLSSDNYHILKEIHGTELVGKRYESLFEVAEAATLEGKENLYKVWAADFVSIDDGTGVLHVAPAFGEDDLNLGQEHNIPVLKTIDASGKVTGDIGYDEIKGFFFKKADKYIIEHLTKADRVYAALTFTHTYPFCWRCETPLMYYAITSWFIKVSAIREQLMGTAEEINWVPENIKSGRFGKWLEGARDWSVSRNRYWGAPMPIWVNTEDEDDYLVIDSYDKLRELAGDKDLDLSDVHRPKVDDVVIEKDGKTYHRVEEVLDCWFESGCMSIGQQHYPFENKDTFEKTFPADFIIEGLDQTRLWFYVQHVVNTILFDSPAYKNVVVNGMIMAADGQKLSKRLKNYPPVDDVYNDEGADTLRLFLLSSTQATQTADYMRFDRDSLKDLNRNVLGTLMNSHRFFKMYADIDAWGPATPGEQPESTSVLDQWMLARLNETIEEVTKQADNYKLAHAIQPIFNLIDDMSNWYIRRSRRRFWKTEDDTDKQQAYETLWFTLVRICQLLAPWAPFLSDYLWSELTDGTGLPKSVHLSDWPKVETLSKKDQSVLELMANTRQVINDALSQRGEAKIKVRQPLSSLTISGLADATAQGYIDIIKEEVNVRDVRFGKATLLDIKITPELQREGLMREIVRHVQNARKKAELNVDDRIELSLVTADKEVLQAIAEHKATIASETLASKLTHEQVALKYTEVVKLEGTELTINIQKAG